jgi:transcription elongation factor GreA
MDIIPTEKVKITNGGFTAIKSKLLQLEQERLTVLDRRNNAREFGDLKENSEYSEAQQRLGNIEAEIEEYKNKLSSFMLFNNMEPKPYVSFGAKVTIENTETNMQKTYYILSEYESDIDKNIISEHSPIAQHMEMKKVNDIFKLANGKTFIVKDIIYPDNYDNLYNECT